MEMNSTLMGPEKLRKQQIELVMELVKGKEYANQLQAIVHKINGDEDLALAEKLAQKVLRSFTDSLAKISLCRTNDLGQIKKDLGEGSKKRSAEMKDKRGCYKRRKEVVSWVIVSPTMDDGYMWRKYGQKEIQNSKHPRCYFRCTHKFDQDCKALKQVQKLVDEGKNMYQTTYFSHHTCRDQTRAQIISNSEVTESTSMIDFRVKMPTNKLVQNMASRNNTFAPSIIKQDNNGDTQSDLTDNVSSMDSNSMWPAFVGSEDFSPKMGPFQDQEVASSFYDRDASTNLEGLEIKSLISDEFPDFSIYDDL